MNTGMSQLGKYLGKSMFSFFEQIFNGHQFVPGSVLRARDRSVNKMDKNPCLPGVDIVVLFAVIQKDL